MSPVLEFILVTVVSFLNLLDKSLQVFGIKLFRMDKESMMKRLTPELQEETKSKDIALPWDLFMKGMENDKMMDFWRRVETSRQLKMILQNRINVRKAIQMNPKMQQVLLRGEFFSAAVLRIPIKRPMFILGLPRSGTTHLFNLLSQAEEASVPLMWQMFNPTPPGKPKNWRKDPRFIQLERSLNIHRALGHKHSDVAHVSRADGPEECALILRFSMVHGQHVLRLPSLEEYSAWYYSRTEEEYEEMYKLYKKVLQIMSYGEGGDNSFMVIIHALNPFVVAVTDKGTGGVTVVTHHEEVSLSLGQIDKRIFRFPDRDLHICTSDITKKRHLMKCIWHCLGVEALYKTFPDACIIYNYRNLDSVVPSACSMSIRTTYAWGPPDDKYGQRIVHSLKQYTDKVMNFMKKYDNKPKKESPLFICNYQSLITDPIGTVKSIYNHFDLELTKASEDNMKQYLNANPQNKHGKHRYSLKDYNLDPDRINEEFAEYIQYMSNKLD